MTGADVGPLVDEPTALAMAGPGRQVAADEFVTYACGMDAVVIVVEAGDRPDGSGVQTRDRLILREPFPGSALEWLELHRRPRLGFVRLRQGCLPLGPLTEVSSRYAERDGVNRVIEMEQRIAEPLSYAVLDVVRPPAAETLPPIDWVHCAPADPVKATRDFLTAWYANVAPPPDLPPQASVRLPLALESFLEVAAGRPEILSPHDEIVPPDRWQTGHGGLVTVAKENQHVWLADMHPAQLDPTIRHRGMDSSWYWGLAPGAAPTRLSDFLFQFALVQAVLGSPFRAAGHITAARLHRLLDPLHQIVPPPGLDATAARYHVAPGLIVGVIPEHGDRFWVECGTRWRSTLRPLRDLDIDWEVYHG